MNRKRTLADDRRRRKLITALWIVVFSVGVVILLYKEMTAILYILATLGVTALLVVVALSDLVHAGQSQVSRANDAGNAATNK
jgi:uncharacterized membrane protein